MCDSDTDKPETETVLASSFVGNKPIPTRREPMGVGETPSLFPGKQSPFSPFSSSSLSLSLTFPVYNSLSHSLSLWLTHSRVPFWTCVPEEGDVGRCGGDSL